LTTVVDSPEEVQKLLEAGYGTAETPGTVLIRLKVSDAGSAQPFSRKFGAPIAWVPEMLDMIRGTRLKHAGWSFHVGSLCNQPNQFAQAIEMCAEATEIARKPAQIIDIGGGFHPDPVSFRDAAAEIVRAQRLFPATTRWIGEPGRFFSAPVVTLRVKVIGVKSRHDRSGWIYTIDESVYGSFSNIPFDGQKPTYRLVAADAAQRPSVRATLFGRTCDSADCLAEDIELPELRVGDVLEVPNMGAYTTVSASYFNGFSKPKRIYALG
jgi:ornithine decarboxylase